MRSELVWDSKMCIIPEECRSYYMIFRDYVYQTKTQTSMCKLLFYLTNIISHAPSAHSKPSSFTSVYECCISWLMWHVLQKHRYLDTKIHGATFQKKEFIIFQLFYFGRHDLANIYNIRLNTVPAEQLLLAYSHMHTQNTVWRMGPASRMMLRCFQDCASIRQEVRHSHYKVFQHAQTKSCTCHEEWNSSSLKAPWKTVKETTKNVMFILCLWFMHHWSILTVWRLTTHIWVVPHR